jgi:hypothetical protein
VFRAIIILFRGALAPSRGIVQRTFVSGGFRHQGEENRAKKIRLAPGIELCRSQ